MLMVVTFKIRPMPTHYNNTSDLFDSLYSEKLSFFCSFLIFLSKQLFQNIILGIPSERKTVWLDQAVVLSAWSDSKTFYKCYYQTILAS